MCFKIASVCTTVNVVQCGLQVGWIHASVGRQLNSIHRIFLVQ